NVKLVMLKGSTTNLGRKGLKGGWLKGIRPSETGARHRV
ncbi:unnamed protein product, partial [marine sediment metagenome]